MSFPISGVQWEDITRSAKHEHIVELTIGDSILMITSDQSRHPMNAFLYVYVPDTDEVYRRAIQTGAVSLEKPAEMPYGDRRAMIRDGWGNTCQIATHRGFRR